MNALKFTIFLFFILLQSFFIQGQNANWGTGLPITATINGSSLDLYVYDPILNQTKTTYLSLGSNIVFQNVDGVVVGTGSYGSMYYATYDVELHTWKSSYSSIGSSNMIIETSDGVVVGTGSYGTMYYATYDVELQTWKSSYSSIGSSNMIIETSDGVVVGTGSYGTMYYATYDVELHTWKSSYSSIGGSNMIIETSDGVVVGTGSYGTMYYATYDVELQTWKSSYSSIGGSNMVIETSDGVVVGIGSYGTMYYSIYDFNLDSWKTSYSSIGSGGVFTLSSGTISYSGSSSGTKGYNTNSQSWGSSPTSPSCKLLPVSFPGSNWVFMRCMSMGASVYTYSCGDGHQISRKQGWKKYNVSGTYNVDLNVSNGVNNSFCNESVVIQTSSGNVCTNSNEPNESLTNAKTISTGIDITGQINNSTDKDYLKFTTTVTNDITVSLTTLPSNYDVKIYDPAGIQIGSSLNTGTSNESIGLTNLTSGTYTIYIYGVSGAFSNTSCYTLRVNTTPTGQGSCSNSFEPNESLAAAKTIGLNTNITGQIASSTDRDFLKYTLTSTSNVVVNLSNLPANYNLKVFTTTGVQIGTSSNTGTASETITLNNQAAGTYVVRIMGVSGSNSSTTCYTLRVNATAVGGNTCSNSNEPNQTLATAKPIAIGVDITGQIASSTDKDYLKFTTTSTGNVAISLTNLPADYDLELYNSANTFIVGSNASGNTSESVNLTNLAAGTYKVYIYGYGGASSTTNCYTLKVTTSGGGVRLAPEENITEEKEQTHTNLLVFPNPNKGVFMLNIEHAQAENVSLRIMDFTGKVVLDQILNLTKGYTQKEVILNNLASGVYLVCLQGENWIKQEKIIVE